MKIYYDNNDYRLKPIFIRYSVIDKFGTKYFDTKYGHNFYSVVDLIVQIKYAHYKKWNFVPYVEIVNIC